MLKLIIKLTNYCDKFFFWNYSEEFNKNIELQTKITKEQIGS